MRVIKLGIISVIVFFIVFTLISFFFPSHVRISKATDIHTTKSRAFIDSSINAMWPVKNTGRAKTGWNIIEGRDPATITVQWYTDFHLRWYPWEKFSSLLLEKTYGPPMEKGLSQLRSALEKP
jgi:hypothetical protein